MLPSILALAALRTSALSIRAPATFFHITDLTASDFHSPDLPESHCVNFTVSNPNAVYEQGGNAPSICRVEWSGTCDPPTCLTPCYNPAYDSGDSPYYARVIPGPSKDAKDWGLQVLEYFTYKNSVLNEVAVPFVAEIDGYECSIDSSVRTVCGITEGDGRDATFATTYSVSYPTDVCPR